MTSVFPPRPAAGPPRQYRFPAMERRALAGGARLVVAPLSKVPLVTVVVVLHRAGADEDPPGREGTADLTATMLLEGTASMDGAALSEYFEKLGSSLSAEADWDSTLISFSVQPQRLVAAVDALRTVLRAPAFPEHELARLQTEHRASRMQVIAEPRSLANAAFSWACYGDASRYRRPLEGTIASVGAITRDDISRFWATHYSPSAITVVMAGDISADQATAAAQSLVEGWDATPATSSPVVVQPRFSTAGLTLIEKADAAQAEIRVGHIGVPRVHEDYFGLTVMNAVVGGLFSSRINLNLRERNGYTYGASSGFDWRRLPGRWFVSTAVKTEVTVSAIREILNEVAQIRSVPIAQDELELASSFLTGVFPLRYETTAAVAAALASQVLFGLPDDYFDTYRDNISGVTPLDVLRTAAAHVHPDRFQVVVAGDPAVLGPALSAADFGDVRTQTPEQVESLP